jgi:hypothetical protein
VTVEQVNFQSGEERINPMSLKNLLIVFIVGNFAFGLVACGGARPVDVQATVESAVQATIAAQPSALPVAAAPPTLVMGPGAGQLFDDFNYTGSSDSNLTAHAWTARGTSGGPGMPGAAWKATNVSFVDDLDLTGNRLMQLTSSTDGTAAKTSQAELYHQRKFYEGTYATRIRFSDAPVSGPDGDNVVETFFTITPLNYDLEPNYGEIDFEYLPNGGWGVPETTFYMTTWETYQADPWLADNLQAHLAQSFDGWHTLMVQVAQGKVKYFLDGQPSADHRDKVYPETPMTIDYNLWFIADGTIKDSALRSYVEQVDWLYYAGNEVLTPEQVDARVAAYRSTGVNHVDTVPNWIPTIESPPTPTPTPAPAGPRPYDLKVKPVSGIKVDGDLKDWPTAPTFTLDQANQIVYALAAGNWAGPSDFSAKLWLGWATDGLYLAAQITDDKLVQEWTGGDIWQGDYLELQVDTQLEADYDVASLTDDDFQLGFAPGDFAGHPANYNVWYGVVDEALKKDIQQAQVKTAEGYNQEIFIPNGALGGMTITDGFSVGLNINPSDCDNNQEPQKLMMSTSSVRALRDPTTWGKVTFVK